MPDLDVLAPLAARPLIEQATTRARLAVDDLLGHRVLRRRSAEVTAESALRAARSSSALDGEHIELERLRGLLMRGLPVGNAHVEAAVRLHAGMGELVEVWKRSPSQALARLHVLAGRGLGDDAPLGRPRSWSLPDAPDPDEVAARLEGLSQVLLAPTGAPALLVAAVVHGELMTLQPFGLADGLVARAAARLTYVSRGLDPKAVSAPEVGHWELHETYRPALASYAAGDLDAWVEHCCDAVVHGALEGRAICEALARD